MPGRKDVVGQGQGLAQKGLGATLGKVGCGRSKVENWKEVKCLQSLGAERRNRWGQEEDYRRVERTETVPLASGDPERPCWPLFYPCARHAYVPLQNMGTSYSEVSELQLDIRRNILIVRTGQSGEGRFPSQYCLMVAFRLWSQTAAGIPALPLRCEIPQSLKGPCSSFQRRG